MSLNEVKEATPAMKLEDLRKRLKKLQEENDSMGEELQKIFTFANDRNVQIFAQAYIAAIRGNYPNPSVIASRCLTDLKLAFGMQEH